MSQLKEAPDWSFKPRQPDDTTRDPISGEFFSTEAIKDSAEALIREGIQNSLDASRQDGPIRVSIQLYGDSSSASQQQVAPFLHGIAPHLRARGNGLQLETMPNTTGACPFLVFEDLGTKGLEGDPLQWHAEESPGNSFFAFFRAEGESDKSSSGRRGRWGVGKFVFPRASRISTFFGLTTRASDKRELLLGRSILKSHRVAEKYHVPDGYFGVRRTLAGGHIIAPTEDEEVIAAFRSTFRLKRSTAEAGLSLVIPWPDEGITVRALSEAVVKDWFFSILSGELEVLFAHDEQETLLTQANFDETFASLGADLQLKLRPHVVLARHYISSPASSHVVIAPPDATGKPKWDSSMLSDRAGADIRAQLREGSPVIVKVPITVRRKDRTTLTSHFDIAIQPDSSADAERPLFVREGVIVTDARGNVIRGHHAIVICNDQPLADLLGDAENPSHTEWRPDTAHFKDKYLFGPGYLSFVKECPARLLGALQQNADDTAPDLFADLLSVPHEPDNEFPRQRETEPKKPGPGPVPPPDPPPASPRRYRIAKLQGGFAFRAGSQAAPIPFTVSLEAAYDVRRGNPFKKYSKADFQFNHGDVRVLGNPRGLSVNQSDPNKLLLTISQVDFELQVVGFDVNRDLAIRVRSTLEDADADQTELD